MHNNTVNLGNGATGRFIESKRFNTSLIAFHFYLPLKSENMTEDALIPYLLTSCSADYRSITELNIKLLKLYGAELGCSVSKSGDYLHTKISMSVINSSFAYDKEDMLSEAAKLLISLIFKPSIDGETFHKADVEREKRKTVERIESEINNKRLFARTRLNEIMFRDEPYGRFVYGDVEEVNKINGKSAYSAWRRFLEESYIQLNVVSESTPTELFESISQCLKKIDRSRAIALTASKSLAPVDAAFRVTDNMEVTQGKLVMGFSSEVSGSFIKGLPLMIFSDVFGGGPYSRLFSNVREKMSLCYYCSSAGRRSKGYLIVDSGVEADKAEAAEKAIMTELYELQKGNIEDSLIDSSKRAIADSLAGYYDNPNALDAWYSMDICEENELTPTEAILLLKNVSKEEIIKAAKGIKLHTVYKLMPEKEVK